MSRSVPVTGAAIAQRLAMDGRLDAVVAKPGFQHVAPVRDFPEEQWFLVRPRSQR